MAVEHDNALCSIVSQIIKMFTVILSHPLFCRGVIVNQMPMLFLHPKYSLFLLSLGSTVEQWINTVTSQQDQDLNPPASWGFSA